MPQGKGRNYINELVERGDLPAFCKLTSGYKNTYGRLVEDRPSTTITNNMCTPSALRCIHYREHRTLSPREGARIQSFPDWFVFCGARVNVTSQIGNAVPSRHIFLQDHYMTYRAHYQKFPQQHSLC